jgi:hypothetical protein
MPQNTSGALRLDHLSSPTHEEHGSGVHSRHLARHSLEGGFTFPNERTPEAATPVPSSRPTALQSSYSTNDLPTVKGNGFDAAITPPKNHAEHLHQHNASLGRIPASAVTNRPTKQESPESEGIKATQANHTMLQASAAPFGPQMPSAAANTGITGSVGPNALPFPVYGYGIHGYAGQHTQAPNQMPAFGAPNTFNGYPSYTGGYRVPEAATRGVPPQRRQTEGEASQTRFTNFPLEHYKGELYSLCKDQHGCRYLQRKLEERNPEHVQMIFSETYMHVIELMTGTSLPSICCIICSLY